MITTTPNKADTLSQELREKLSSQNIGERFLTFREIMKEYQVSQSVVDRTISQLRAENLLTVKPGRRGLFVSSPDSRITEPTPNAVGEVLFMMPRWLSCEIEELNNAAAQMNGQDGDLRIRCEYFDVSNTIPRNLDARLRQAAGMIIMPAGGSVKQDDMEALLRYCEIRPTVVFGHYFDAFGIGSVGLDDFAAASLAMHHLVENGHRRVGLLLSEPHNQTILDRVRGAESYARLHGVKIDLIDCDVVSGEIAVTKAYDTFSRVINDGFAFTALIGVSGESLLGAVNACRNHRVAVPEQLSIVAISGEELTRTGCPPLDTVACDVSGQLGKAFEMIVEMKKNHVVFPFQNQYWETELIIRNSVIHR